MEPTDVKTIRQLLRKVKYTKTVKDKATGAVTKVEDIVPISIEFDNSLALSEETDIVMWDDKTNMVYGIGFNSNVVKGAQMITGRSKPGNPGALFVVDYGEIQQIRAAINEELMRKFMNEFKALGAKINFGGAEVALNDTAIENAINHIVGGTDPMEVIIKDKKLEY